ncbi:MAG: hypothetical protein WDN28_16585 [Chthoniobacter sp.]
MTSTLLDQLHRPLRDLRISVTDRCNFRCGYCMPKAVFGRGYDFLPKDDVLTFEEIARLAPPFRGARHGENPADRRRTSVAPRTPPPGLLTRRHR